MEFEGEFSVPGDPDEVVRRFTDIERMARCMPGASLEGQDEDGDYIGVMTVAFGPKKLKFKGRMNCTFDLAARTGVLNGRGAADARAARVSFRTQFNVTSAGEIDGAPVSLVRLVSSAELGGVIADFARTGGVALANVLMQEFAANLAREFASDEPDRPMPEAKALSATKVAWTAVRSKFASWQ